MSYLETATKRERTSIVKSIDRTIAKLQEVGWCKNQSRKSDADGNVVAFCVSGAMSEVIASSGTLEAVSDYLRSAGKRRDGSVVGYNDSRKTTKRNVLDALRGTKRMVENYTPSK